MTLSNPAQQILEYLHDAVIITDLEGNITSWNQSAVRMFGYSKQEIIGKTPSILHDPTDAPILTKAILKGVAKDGSWSGEIAFHCKNGDEGICETTVAPLFDDAGQQIGTVGVNRDITARKAAERQIANHKVELERKVEIRTRELSEARSRIQYLVSAGPAAIYTCKARGNFAATYVSPNIKQLSGHSCEEFVSNENFWSDHIHPDDREFVLRESEKTLLHESHSLEYRFLTADGTYIWFATR